MKRAFLDKFVTRVEELEKKFRGRNFQSEVALATDQWDNKNTFSNLILNNTVFVPGGLRRGQRINLKL